jgi:hypothetical protein
MIGRRLAERDIEQLDSRQPYQPEQLMIEAPRSFKEI